MVIRLYRGNAPAGGILLDANDEWSLYERNRKDGFVNLKLVSHAPAPKANFYLGYSLATGKLVTNADGKVLQRHHTLLCEWVMQVLAAKAKLPSDL